MQIEKIVVGALEENCYIVSNCDEVLIVDPGDEFFKIKSKIENRKVVGVLVTHHHFDHIGSLDEVLKYYQVPLYDFYHTEEKKYNVLSFHFRVIKTPGHSIDSITFYFEKEKVMFVGDFIFQGSIGRCDLDGGNFNEMKKSIQKIKEYKDDNILLLPGHGNQTTLKNEKIYNSYFVN